MEIALANILKREHIHQNQCNIDIWVDAIFSTLLSIGTKDMMKEGSMDDHRMNEMEEHKHCTDDDYLLGSGDRDRERERGNEIKCIVRI